MAKPKVYVKHLIVCTNAGWEGLPGPRTARTLEGVNYAYQIAPDAEAPELDFWLYARFYLLNEIAGFRNFSVEVIWLDAPSSPRLIDNRPLERVRFTPRSPVVNRAWPIAGLRIPGRGRIDFRLLCEYRTWQGIRNQIVGTESIRIE